MHHKFNLMTSICIFQITQEFWQNGDMYMYQLPDMVFHNL